MKEERSRSIYLLPNFFTTTSLFAAFYSIVASTKNQFEIAVIAIFIGMIADGLDGRIARLTNTQTEFGAQYDSLADMVTFGVAPALLLYNSNLAILGKSGWLIAFIYTACVALRLARFNSQVSEDNSFFQGLACPAAAALLSSFVWLSITESFYTSCLAGLLTVLTAILMVSNIKYYSFKKFDMRCKISFIYVLLMITMFVAVALSPALVLFTIFMIYVISGPLQACTKKYK